MKDHVQPLKKHNESDCCTSLPAFAWLLLLCEAAEYPLKKNNMAVVDLYSVFAWDSQYSSKLSKVAFCTNVRQAEVHSELKNNLLMWKANTKLLQDPKGTYLQDRHSVKYQQQFRHWCSNAILECTWWLCLKFHNVSNMLYVGLETGYHRGRQHTVTKTVYIWV